MIERRDPDTGITLYVAWALAILLFITFTAIIVWSFASALVSMY